MPKCEPLASHRACSWVLRKLWPKPVSLSCHQPTALSNHVPRSQGKRPGIPHVTSALSFPQPSGCLVVTTATCSLGLGDCPLANRLVTSSPSWTPEYLGYSPFTRRKGGSLTPNSNGCQVHVLLKSCHRTMLMLSRKKMCHCCNPVILPITPDLMSTIQGRAKSPCCPHLLRLLPHQSQRSNQVAGQTEGPF